MESTEIINMNRIRNVVDHCTVPVNLSHPCRYLVWSCKVEVANEEMIYVTLMSGEHQRE